ncbi:MAG: helix-turn-helix domain-containing protein [Clostridia bacterium]|nr:helix-turn-helix domain-containing protein [Clostridia bacterium]
MWENIVMQESFGEKLKELRQEKNIGQIQLAKELGVGKSVISLWELNRCEPTLSNLVKIAEFFGVSIDYLAGLEKI